MSVLLWVENARPFYLNELLPRVNDVLKSLLGIKDDIKLKGVQTWKPEENLQEMVYIELHSPSFGVKVIGETALVSVIPSEKYKAMCVSPDGWRSKLEYALAAAVAIAICECSESVITDSGGVYTKAPYSQSAKEFAESIKVAEGFDDFNKAAHVFISRLPVSSKKN
jgi:hypothetical protein